MSKGFTLLEIVVVIAIVSLLAILVSGIAVTIFSGSTGQYTYMDNVDQARIAVSRFVNEIRSATTGVDGSYAIGEAGNSQIIFFSKSGSGSVNRIRYFVSGNVLYKGVVAPTGSPLFYNLSLEKVSRVQENLMLSETPLFYYYDGDYDGSTNPLSQPVNLNQVRFARMNLVVQKKIEAGSGTFTATAGSSIRNLKTNLGSD